MFLLSLQDWMNYLGHYHPLLVHLPIGILIVAIIMEIIAWRTGQPLDAAIGICLACACISAAASCVLGWFLSREGGYEENTLLLHQWMGISLAAVTGLAWLIHRMRWKKIYRGLLLLSLLLLAITGHQGGNMTHGEDYLTAGMPQPFANWLGISAQPDSIVPRPPISNIDEAIVFHDLVMPVLEQKCFACHSSAKVKGGLRLDTESLLFKGGKHGVVIHAGDIGNSNFIQRLLLPLENDERMPPKEKEQLSEEEIKLLTWWVQTGADVNKKVAQLEPDSSTRSWLLSFASGKEGKSEQEPRALSPVYDLQPPAPDSALLVALKKRALLISPLAQGKTLLQVSCINRPDMTDADLEALLPLKENMVWLQAQNTKITNAGLRTLGQFPQLVQLNLSGTSITSEGLASLTSLTHLETLNLTHTAVDDAALTTLLQLPALRTVYCWDTRITPAALSRVATTHPMIRFVLPLGKN